MRTLEVARESRFRLQATSLTALRTRPHSRTVKWRATDGGDRNPHAGVTIWALCGLSPQGRQLLLTDGQQVLEVEDIPGRSLGQLPQALVMGVHGPRRRWHDQHRRPAELALDLVAGQQVADREE
jgi:hypothetical protein